MIPKDVATKLNQLANELENLPPDIQDLVNKHFWDLVDKDKPMDKPLKVRLTREQIVGLISERVQGKAGTRFTYSTEPYEIEISPSQIIHEKSNREKWETIFLHYLRTERIKEDGTIKNPESLFLDKLESIDCDAAYRAVVGED